MEIEKKLEVRLNNMEALEQALRKQLNTIEQQPPGAGLTDLKDSGLTIERLIEEILRADKINNETRELIREAKRQVGQTKELLKEVDKALSLDKVIK